MSVFAKLVGSGRLAHHHDYIRDIWLKYELNRPKVNNLRGWSFSITYWDDDLEENEMVFYMPIQTQYVVVEEYSNARA